MIISKSNFIEVLPVIIEKIRNWQKLKVEPLENENWETVVDFWNWVKVEEVLEFLEKIDGWKMEKTTSEIW